MTRRTVVRLGAVALALLGVVALVVRPQRDTEAEARVTVPTALEVNEVVDAIRADAVDATVTADGRRVTVAFSGDDSFVARTYATVLARGGLEAARKRQTAAQTRLAEAARADGEEAGAKRALNALRTGVDDPEVEYRELVERGRELEAQRRAAEEAGQPTLAIENALAVNQEDTAEMQLQVTSYADLTAAIDAADDRALAASRAIATTDRAARAASVRVSTREVGFGFGVLPGVVILVLAGMVLLVNELVSRRTTSREAEIDIRSEPVPEVAIEPELVAMVKSKPAPAAPDDNDDAATRFSRFYRALEPSAPPLEIDLTSPVDLADDEIREVNGDLEQQGIGEQPQAGDANATRFSR